MSFIVIHFKERNLQRCFWLFTSLSNSYDKSFSKKKMFGKVLNRALISFLTIVNAKREYIERVNRERVNRNRE